MRFLTSKKQYGLLKCQKALTLAECLVSVLLLAITLVAGMAFYFNSGAIMSRAMHKKIAMEMANQAMETIKQNGYAVLSESPAGNFEGPEVKTFGDFSAKIWKRVPPPVEAKIKQVEIKVTWIESGKDQEIALSTYLAAP